MSDSGSSSSLSSLDPDPSKDPQIPSYVDPQVGQSSTSTLPALNPEPSGDAELLMDLDDPRERSSSASSLTTLDPGSSQDPPFPPSPTYWDRDYPPGQIPPLRCRRAALHQTWGTRSGMRQWYKLWGADEFPAVYNVEDIIIAGGVTVVQKLVERDSIVAVKIAVQDPRDRDNDVFHVQYDAAAKQYMVTFEVAGFSHYLHGKPRLRRGYTHPIVPHERLPVGRGSPAPLRPNAYDVSRQWVKSIGSSYNLNHAIRNFRSREFPIIFALHEQTKVIRLFFYARDFVGREDGGEWCEHEDHIRHIEHLLLNKAHPNFVHDGDIFLEKTFEGFADFVDSEHDFI